MRGPQLPIGAITLVSSGIGALTFANGLDIGNSDGITTSIRTPTGNKPRSSPEKTGSGFWRLGYLVRAMFSPPTQLIPWACHADASGYDATDPTPAPLLPFPPSSGNDSDGDSNNDTITGVFHRLDPHRAKLLLVQVVFRHGARTPLSSRLELWRGQQWDVCGEAYKAAVVRLFSTAGVENPVSKHDLRQRSVILEGGCRKGELTLLGQSQALQLGRWLRSRYVEEAAFMPPEHRASVLEARTTNFSRTIATLRGVLTGLYPDLAVRQQQQQQQGQQQQGQHGEGDTSSSSSLVPRVTTSGDLDEILYADTRACPHLDSFKAMTRETGRAAVRSDPEFMWARGELLRLLKLDPIAFDKDRWIFTEVHDVLTSLEAHGKALPPGFEDQHLLRAAINRLATKEFSAEVAPSVRDSHGRTVLRLSMGRLLHILVDNMQRATATAAPAPAAVESSPSTLAVAVTSASAWTGPGTAAGTAAVLSGGGTRPQIYLYSGHDSTIMPLLSALGVDVTEWPPYLSNVVLELWQLAPKAPGDAPRHVVRVLYNQQELPLPHCPPGFLPSLPTFTREVVGPFLLSAQRHQELCRVKVEHEGAMPQPKARAKTA